MGKKLPHTPNSKIKAALRQLWLRSRERASALKRDNYTCQSCGVKQSKAKGREVDVQVHHVNAINWHDIYLYIRENLLTNPDEQITLCKQCHRDIHSKDKGGK